MTKWDFCADVDALVSLSLDGRGPVAMTEIMDTAAATVDRLGEQTPESLSSWLHANAVTLLAQQLLVASVHSQVDVDERFDQAVSQWRNQVANHSDKGGDEQSALDWLRANRPGLLRAWLLTQLPSLVGRRIAGEHDFLPSDRDL